MGSLLADGSLSTTTGHVMHLYDKLRKRRSLRRAWQVVYSNGVKSKSEHTRQEVADFAENAETNLARIERQLRTRKFMFAPSRGIPIAKKNKPGKKRPIVMSPVPNRIVQRAILDVVQELPEIRVKQNSGFNFGGIPGIGVPEAVEFAYRTALTYPYFIRTDIRAFFDNIPRSTALEKISSLVEDDDFNDLLKRATDTELDNLVQLGIDEQLFPLEDDGVAQGSCLSPLLCNLLLHEFDQQMNGSGIVCIRYIDDFILFGTNEGKVFKALKSSKKHLAKFHLDVYDPLENQDKAEYGKSRDGFDFLGCSVRWDRIRPSDKSKKRLITRVKELFSTTMKQSINPISAVSHHQTYVDTVRNVSNIVRGWGNTYSFCTDDRLMKNIDQEIDQLLLPFNRHFKNRLKPLSPQDRRRLLGLFLIEDCNKDERIREIVDAEIERVKFNGM